MCIVNSINRNHYNHTTSLNCTLAVQLSFPRNASSLLGQTLFGHGGISKLSIAMLELSPTSGRGPEALELVSVADGFKTVNLLVRQTNCCCYFNIDYVSHRNEQTILLLHLPQLLAHQTRGKRKMLISQLVRQTNLHVSKHNSTTEIKLLSANSHLRLQSRYTHCNMVCNAQSVQYLPALIWLGSKPMHLLETTSKTLKLGICQGK